MRIVVSILAILFGLLHIIAAITQLQSKDSSAKGIGALMACGSVELISVACVHMSSEGRASWLTAACAIIGFAIICYAAYANGKRAGNVHLSHHAIRGGIAALLVICLAIW